MEALINLHIPQVIFLYSSATNTLSKLGIGTGGQVLTVTGGVPVWAGGIGGTGSWVTGKELQVSWHQITLMTIW